MKKKEGKNKSNKGDGVVTRLIGEITSETELKAYLLNIKDKMVDEIAAPVYAGAAMNQVLTNPDHLKFLNDENKEIARDIWLRVKQSGFQMRNPPVLFGNTEDGIEGGAIS